MIFNVAWSIGGIGSNKNDCTWNEISTLLEKIRYASGSLSMSILNEQEIGPQFLELRAENKTYLITLGEDNGDDYIVRSYTNTAAHHEMVYIMGDKWDARQLTSDFQLIESIFKDFFYTGNVPYNILS